MIHGFKNKGQQGAILVFSLLILAVVMSISFSVLGIFLPKIKIASDPLKSAIAFYAADSATEWCLHMNTNYSKPNPVLAYSFYEGSGNVVASSYFADAQYNGIRSGAGATWTTGIQNNAMNFNGSSGEVVVAQGAGMAMDLVNSFTISAWVYPTNITGVRTVVMRESNEGGSFYWLRLVNGQISSGFKTGPTGGWSMQDHLGGSVPLNAWTHIAGVLDDAANTFTLYQDGVPVSTVIQNYNGDVSDDNVQIGRSMCISLTGVMGYSCSSNQYQRFYGSIDEIRIYKDKALTQSQIIEDMDSALPIPSTTPVPTPAPPLLPVMSNGSTYSIYSPASGVTSSNCIEGRFNHRIVGTYNDVARSLEIFE